jgi:nucleoside-diphosphate-sugar epimerase
MHILVTGAAGMIGRKLTASLAKDGHLNGQQIDRLTLTDIIAPEKPAGFAGAVDLSASDLSSPGAAVGFLIHAAGLTRQKLGARINLSMPGISCTVGEQIEALRRVAGDKVAARIRPAPDELVQRIVAGWAERLDAKRARDLGFKAEATFDDIIRAHIEDELSGKIAN